MRIGRVIGRVTLNRIHPALQGARFLIALPLSLQTLSAGTGPAAEEVVVYDELGAGSGSLIGISEGREAANPFYPDKKPVDAYNACILDRIDLGPARTPRPTPAGPGESMP